jgi:rare lipoprotein A
MPKFFLLPALPAMLATVLTIAPLALAQPVKSATASRQNQKVKPGQTFTGKATRYPNKLEGHETAGGETFHQNDHTAASNKLPIGSDVKVTNLKSGKSTDVTLTDRGRALGSRKIDLSRKAASDIGLTRKEGKVPVKIKVERTPDGRPAPPGK